MGQDGVMTSTTEAGATAHPTSGTDGTEYRIEHDTMGEVRVPVHALYRAQTQRAVENFPISGTRLERSHIEALARIKKAAARANAELGFTATVTPEQGLAEFATAPLRD